MYEMANTALAIEPSSYQESVNCHEEQEWKIAIAGECDSYHKHSFLNKMQDGHSKSQLTVKATM